MTGIEMIAAERERQITEEGYTPEHDAQHDEADLAFAAAVYAAPAMICLVRVEDREIGGSVRWVEPWPIAWKRPERAGEDREARLRELAKAGALCAAEMDRIMAEPA